jgi:alpha 1,3-glucosidase
MKWDPYTLVVVLDKNGCAEGTLYVDDGETFDYQKGAYIHRRFRFSKSSLSSENIGTDGPKTAEYLRTMAAVWIEKIVVVGAPSDWKGKSGVVVLEEDAKSGVQAGLTFYARKDGKASYAVIKDPHVLIGKSWKIDFA